jgi:hypothetical protein
MNEAAHKVRIGFALFLAFELAGAPSALAMWDLRACWLNLVSPSYRRQQAEKRQFDLDLSSVEVIRRESSDREMLSYLWLLVSADKVDRLSLRRPGIALAFEFLTSSGDFVGESQPNKVEAARYDSWRTSGEWILRDALAEALGRMRTKGTLEEIAQIRIRVARTAGEEEELESRRIVVSASRAAAGFGLKVPIEFNVAQRAEPKEVASNTFLAHMSSFWLVPDSRYEKNVTHLKEERIPPGALDVDEEGKLVAPFALPDGIRIDLPAPRFSGESPLRSMTVPIELHGKPVFAVREREGIHFGTDWFQPNLSLTLYKWTPTASSKD